MATVVPPSGSRPLPPDALFLDRPALHEAYESLLAYQARHPEPALTARWLGHLLREVPVQEHLAREITDCRNIDSNLDDLSEKYISLLLKFCE